jgi:hypothetical protein
VAALMRWFVQQDAKYAIPPSILYVCVVEAIRADARYKIDLEIIIRDQTTTTATLMAAMALVATRVETSPSASILGLMANAPIPAPSGHSDNVKICFSFRDSKKCARGESCPFSHKSADLLAHAARRAASGRPGREGKRGDTSSRSCLICDASTHTVKACPSLIQARAQAKPTPGPAAVNGSLAQVDPPGGAATPAAVKTLDGKFARTVAAPPVGVVAWQRPPQIEADDAALDKMLTSAAYIDARGVMDGAFP